MKLKLIACKVLSRELCHLAALSPNTVDVTFMRQGYHCAPDTLRAILQREIDSVESGEDPHTNGPAGDPYEPAFPPFDAILLGYGLCSNAIAGLCSGSLPLVIPRGHDCITFFLGSKERYRKLFDSMRGCYWYTASWIENSAMPCEAEHRDRLQKYLDDGYDEDEAEFLMETLEGWTNEYTDAVYIKMPVYEKQEYQEFTRSAAEYFGWKYTQLDGDLSLLQRFVNGEWNPEDFLVVPPHCRVKATAGSDIITFEPCGEGK